MSYDNWKLANPKSYDFEPETERCDGCDCEISEIAASEDVGFCEDCLCDYDYNSETKIETECDGCFYCLCVKDYKERKAKGTLKVD